MILCQDLQAHMEWLAEIQTQDWEERPEKPLSSNSGDVDFRILPPVTLGKGHSALTTAHIL